MWAMTLAGLVVVGRGAERRTGTSMSSSWRRAIIALHAGDVARWRRSRPAAAAIGAAPSASIARLVHAGGVVVADELLDAAARPAVAFAETSSRMTLSWSLASSPAAQRRLQRTMEGGIGLARAPGAVGELEEVGAGVGAAVEVAEVDPLRRRTGCRRSGSGHGSG